MGGRVLRIVTRLNRGGPLRQLEALVSGLSALGWHGPVLSGRPAAGEADGTQDLGDAGGRVVLLPALGRRVDPGADARALREIGRWIRRLRPDVVHTHMGKAGALGRMAARAAGVPAVHTFHGHHFTAPGMRGEAARRVERLLGAATTAAVVLSERQRRDVVETYRVLPASKVHVIGPAIDTEAFARRAADPAARAVVERWRSAGRPLLLWVGRFVEVKDPLLLVEAVSRTRAPLCVAMVGDGPLRARVEAEVARRGLGDRLVVPGPAPHTAAWTVAADAVVLSSQSEGTPIAVVEALVAGRPVVAPDVGGIADLVKDGEEGLLVPAGDAAALAAALDRVAADAVLRQRLARGAAAAASGGRFGALRAARATADLYEAVRGRDSTIGA